MRYARIPNKSLGRSRRPARSTARKPRGPDWHEKLSWAFREKTGTVLSAAEVRDFARDYDDLIRVLTESGLVQ